MRSGLGRLRRWRAERYGVPVHDADVHGLLLELEEVRLWEDEVERARKGQRRERQPSFIGDDEDDGLWAAAERAARGAMGEDDGEDGDGPYRPKVTGDPVIDHLEQQIAKGEEPDWHLLE